MSSDFSIALLLASLKSDHMPGAPVRLTVVDAVASRSASFALEVVRGADHLGRARGRAAARAATVRPSCETCGGATVRDARDRPRGARVASRDGRSRSPGAVDDHHERVAALAARTTRRSRSRAATDSEPVASQPAPESACSALGAKTPRPTATTAQAMTTSRTWPAVQRPSRPIGPTLGHRVPPRRAEARRCGASTSDAGQAPTSAKSHWLAATNAAEEQEPRADGERRGRPRAASSCRRARTGRASSGERRAAHRNDPPTSSARSLNWRLQAAADLLTEPSTLSSAIA